MKHLIVGAGATFAQARALDNPIDVCPPLIRDFSRKTWANYTPHSFLEEYLHKLGYEDLGRDPRILFFDLEDKGVTNIERFMEFVWLNRDSNFKVSENPPPGYISGLHIRAGGDGTANPPATFWDDLLYNGIGTPLAFHMIQCFFENGVGWRSLDLTKSVASKFEPGDLILNLNYDTTFEIALEQLARPFIYAPGVASPAQLLVRKPHGSLNLVTNENAFTFGEPSWLGSPEPEGYRSYTGFIPPRLNKQYAQHPIGKMILDAVRDRHPRRIAMWGVGLTDSDTDLIALYLSWVKRAGSVDIINPSVDVAEKARHIFKCEVRHFADVSDWKIMPT